MGENKEIYLIRHGETESNKKGIFRGRLDIPLSQTGKEQASSVFNYFKGKNIELVLSSPLSRALETAKIIFPDKEIKIEERLNNLDLGNWSGVEKEKIKREKPNKWKIWVETPEKIKFPGGESIKDVYKRVSSLLNSLKTVKADKIALISHRSVLKTLLAASIGMKDNFFWKFHLDNASISILIFNSSREYTIYKLNDTSHLESFVSEWY